MKLAQALENASALQDSNRSLLRLTYVLQQRVCYLATSQLGARFSQPACLRLEFTVSYRVTNVTARLVGKFTQGTPGQL